MYKVSVLVYGDRQHADARVVGTPRIHKQMLLVLASCWGHFYFSGYLSISCFAHKLNYAVVL